MAELLEVNLKSPETNYGDYKKINSGVFHQLKTAAAKLKGKKVIHVNATPFGGGVAEILRSQVPFEQYLGIQSRWLVLRAPKQFFVITKKIHNLIQGKPGLLSADEKNFYLGVNQELSQRFQKILEKLNPDIVFIHDPQPLPLIQFLSPNCPVILRLHIDLSSPNPSIIEFLRPFIERYQSVILSSKDYLSALRFLKKSLVKIIPPAIDPLTAKNCPMDKRTAALILEKLEINYLKPVIAQVSRFDPWKDPLGVIKAYYIAKKEIENLQLVLAGFQLAKDDPEAAMVFKEVEKHAKGDPDIFLFSDPRQLGDVQNDIFINALYTTSALIIQKSIREGFGLTMTEAMWKGKAVIAGKTSGALLQIKNNKNGVLVSSPEEAAGAIVRLIKNERLRERLGKAARQSAKERFLMPKHVLSNIKEYQSLLNRA